MSAPAPAFDREAFLAQLWAMDEALVEQGFPPMSPWWRAEITRFVRSGARRWVIRVGRRGGKSSTLCRLAVAVAWFGAWHVPPGDTAVVPFVSVSKDEAASRLRTIAAILKALGLPFEPRGDELELTAPRTVLFRTIAATTKASVGFTSIAAFGDEVARWESRETGANPAKEVIGSLMPTLATQPHGFAALCSSPWGTDDYHATAFDEGDTDHQCVSYAPSWVANPTLTEEETHALEPDERIWQREYKAIPGATLTAAFDLEDLSACFRALPRSLGSPFMSIDASSLRGDAFAWATGGSAGDVLCVADVGGWDAEQQRHVSMGDIVQDLSDRAKRCGTSTVFGDQREEASLRTLFDQHGVALVSFAWSEPSKDDAAMLLRRLMRERRLVLVEHAQLRSELTNLKARLLPSGRTRYETSGVDYASCLVTLAHAIGDHRYDFNSDPDDHLPIHIQSERSAAYARPSKHNALTNARLARWRAAGVINDD